MEGVGGCTLSRQEGPQEGAETQLSRQAQGVQGEERLLAITGTPSSVPSATVGTRIHVFSTVVTPFAPTA